MWGLGRDQGQVLPSLSHIATSAKDACAVPEIVGYAALGSAPLGQTGRARKR